MNAAKLSIVGERALSILEGGKWHSTAELRRRLGPRFGFGLYQLKHRYGLSVERRPHPKQRLHYQYRLAGCS